MIYCKCRLSPNDLIWKHLKIIFLLWKRMLRRCFYGNSLMIVLNWTLNSERKLTDCSPSSTKNYFTKRQFSFTIHSVQFKTIIKRLSFWFCDYSPTQVDWWLDNNINWSGWNLGKATFKTRTFRWSKLQTSSSTHQWTFFCPPRIVFVISFAFSSTYFFKKGSVRW